eukprot:CAMPEP_0194214992 /NCGR_PEP_ID=MMETSP0156-20130528/16467_1 /TAXON_ID=33649 /ORGANISM="Thalassionema nitzschioides, Strain L26-B" /LENGTH=230 /DNA_ID=CAMNT_0038943389 /DNA_START=71 /DNA_END=760 /DNA_ORIENTATION=-
MRCICFLLGLFLAYTEARYLRVEENEENIAHTNTRDFGSARNLSGGSVINFIFASKTTPGGGFGVSNSYVAGDGSRKLYTFGVNGYGNAGSGSSVLAGGNSNSESGGGGQTLAEKGSFGSSGGGGWGGGSSGGIAATTGMGHGIGFGSSLTNPYSEGRTGSGWGGGRAETLSLGSAGGSGGGIGSSGSSSAGSALSSGFGLGTGLVMVLALVIQALSVKEEAAERGIRET